MWLLVSRQCTFETLKEQDMLLPLESPELKGIPEEYIDKDQYVYRNKGDHNRYCITTQIW